MTDEPLHSPGRSALQQQLGIRFDHRSLQQITLQALSAPATTTFYVTCNLNHLRVLQSDPVFRDAYHKAAVVTLDSRPMQMISRLRYGERVPLVTGADLFATLMDNLRPGSDRPFFVASSHDVGSSLCRHLIERGFAQEAVTFISPAFGFEKDPASAGTLLGHIEAHRTTHLFMGLGAPKSERWVSQHFDRLPACHVFCVGAALDFTSGLKSRAPTWMGQLGIEWLHRMLSEPRRLLPRYAGDALLLLRVVAGKRLVAIR